MAGKYAGDIRLLQAYELLHSVIEEDDAPLGELHSQWQSPLLPVADPEGRMSATDLLNWWFRAPSSQPNPWDIYFGEALRTTTAPLEPHLDGPRKALAQGSSRGMDRPAAPPPPDIHKWTLLQANVNDAEDFVSDQDAEAAVGSLYEFVHAIGRQDVDGAMKMIREDYHALENDREIDRLTLRHQITSLLDSLLGWEVEASLGEIPNPIPSRNGLLIFAEIQFNCYHREDDRRRSIVERRVAILQQQQNGDWAISSLSHVRDQNSSWKHEKAQ
jgi:ketosteroid isomerase-like protein